jgi:hypothetical protein
MGYCMSIFSFLFLVAAISAQLISFLTSYMYENKGNAINVIYGALTDPTTLLDGHCGIFRRCSRFEICSWWDMNIFQKDARKNKFSFSLSHVFLFVFFRLRLFCFWFLRMATRRCDNGICFRRLACTHRHFQSCKLHTKISIKTPHGFQRDHSTHKW